MNMKRLMSAVLAVALLLNLLPASALAFQWGGERTYGEYAFTKISNPDAGFGEPDGLNTDDSTGFGANRLNSSAGAAVSRGDSIYIGTGRNLLGAALSGAGLALEKLNALVSAVFGGDIPLGLDEEDPIPQILRFDVENGTTKVIYRPATARSEDGTLYYVDKDTAILPGARVASEMASFGWALEYGGNLYFGTTGSHMGQVVRVDQEDHGEVVFSTGGLGGSCLHGETIYFCGQDTAYLPWLEDSDSGVMPLVIGYLDPATAGSEAEDWSGLVADFRDFGQYAQTCSGGNHGNLCSYNGKLYFTLPYDRGWAMFRGEKAPGDPEANGFGWKWTEIVGDDSIYSYPLAMDAEVEEGNRTLREDYGAGLLESAATPYVYKGKMYLGTLDNVTYLQSQTMAKLMMKLACLLSAGISGETGPALTQIYGPICEALTHPQHLWVMDESETITAVDSANQLLAGTGSQYVGPFAERGGKLFAATFDGATAYTCCNLSPMKLVAMLQGQDPEEERFQAELEASNLGQLLAEVEDLLENGATLQGEFGGEIREMLEKTAATCRSLFEVLQSGASVESLLENVMDLGPLFLLVKSYLPDGLAEKIGWLLKAVDLEGLQCWVKARELVGQSEAGFDLLVSQDGETWNKLVKDGLGDPCNYGAGTLTLHQGDLYIGTANPYFGAQLWKMTDADPIVLPATLEMTAGEVMPGFVNRGLGSSSDPTVAWVDGEGNLKALKAGTAVISAGSTACTVTVKDYEDGSEVVGQLKILARFNDSMQFYDGHCYLLFTSYKDGVTLRVEDLYGGYEISDLYYEDMGRDISYGSNHNKATAVEDYFTFREGMQEVTLDRGEIVTIGMYRDFDLTTEQAAMGALKNSSLWSSLSDAVKTGVMELFFRYLDGETISVETSLLAPLKQILGENADYTKLLDGVVPGGVCFNRELYNQKLEWDQYENVTYELDITENQLNALAQSLNGNLDHFSILKNSCVTVALRAWNAAVGIRDGVDTAYKLESGGKGIYSVMDAPKNAKSEIMNKLPGYYLNNAQGVAEPNAGYQDDTGWVYVSAPETLGGGETAENGNRLRITVTPASLAAKTKVYFMEGQQEQVLSLSELNRLGAGTEFYVKSVMKDFLSDITLNGLSILDGESYDAEKGYLAVMPEGHARLGILYDYENAAVLSLKPSPVQVTAGTVLKVEDYACLSAGSVQSNDVVWDSVVAVESDALTVSPDGKTLTANKACTAAASVRAASDDDVSSQWLLLEVVDSFDDMAQVTFNESGHFGLAVEGGGMVPYSGYRVKKGSVLTVVPQTQEQMVLSQVTANGEPVPAGGTIPVDGDTQVQVECRQAEIRNLPDSLRLTETGETGTLLPVVAYTDSEDAVYDPSVTYQYDPTLITVDETGIVTVTGEIPQWGGVVPVTVVAGSSGGQVTATVEVILRDFQADEIVGRLTLSGRTSTVKEEIAHGCITFTPYEDMDMEVSYNNYYEPTQAYHDLMTDYRDHPENYVSDPARYNEELDLAVPQSNVEYYFTTHYNGPYSAPETIHLQAGESMTVSNYGAEVSYLTLLRDVLQKGSIYWISQDARDLEEHIERYAAGQEIDGPAAFDSLVNAMVTTYAISVATGHNPADGVTPDGQEINREIYNQFQRDNGQLPNTYYTLEITRAHLAALKAYLSNPENNYYAVFIKNCASGVADLWNATLYDRPDLKITANYTGFAVDPESLHVELGLLWLKTGRTFDGTGEGGGINFDPRISPAWVKVTVTPDDMTKYEGDTDPQLTATVTGLPQEGTLHYTLEREPGERVGTYAIKVNLGENPSYYKVTTGEGTFTILAKDTGGEDKEDDEGGGSYDSDDSDDSDSGAALDPMSQFTDTSSDAWYGAGVRWAVENGIMKGISATAFQPDGSATRAMVVTMLWRLAKEPASGTRASFTDTAAGSWYAAAVDWAAETGLVKGTSEFTFSPDAPVTREQLATMLYRYAQARGKGFAGTWAFQTAFPDVAEVADFAQEAVCWMTLHGVIRGMGDGTLSPREIASRAQIATMFMRFSQAMDK